RPERSGRNIRVVIFIDDLDRCPPAKAVEVLEAIILLLADENKMPFVVVLGIDARVIVKAVEERYGKVLVEAGISGYEYLDKIVQIPFRIPPAGPLEIETYVDSLIYRSGQEKAEALKDKLSPNVEPDLLNILVTDEKLVNLWGEIDTLQTDIISLPGLNATSLNQQLDQLGSARNLILAGRDNLPEAEKAVAAVKKQLGRRPEAQQTPVAPEPIFSPEEADTIKQFARSEWLSRNPRRVKRIINVYRISRSLDPDTSSAHRQKLIKWIVMSEQWPYRTAWIMQHIEDDEQSEKELEATDTLQTVFTNVRDDVLAKDAQAFATLEDAELFDGFIDDKNEPKLTVADVRGLRRYTFNLNPALQEEVQKAAARKKGEPAKPPTTVVKLDPSLEQELRKVLDQLTTPKP
ncbi:MAG: P-loop NTPase fold protein, partial [Chloroflexota bacterium]